MTQRWHG